MDDELREQMLARLMAGEKSEPRGGLDNGYDHPIPDAFIDKHPEAMEIPEDFEGGYTPKGALSEFLDPSPKPGMLDKLNQGLGKVAHDMQTKNIYGEDVDKMWADKLAEMKQNRHFDLLKKKMSGQ